MFGSKQYGYPKWRQRGQIWASLETNFVTKTCTLETNFGEWLTLVRGFYYCWQRMYVFLDWPPPLKYSGREKSKLFFSYSQNRSKHFYAGRTKKKPENFDWIITARLSFHHQTSFFTTSMDFRCLPGAKQISTAENRHGQIKWNTTTWTVIDCATPPLYVLYFRSFRAHRALTFYMYKTVHAQHDVKGRWLWCTWKSTENGVSDDSLNKVTFLVDQTSTL